MRQNSAETEQPVRLHTERELRRRRNRRNKIVNVGAAVA